MFQACVKLLPLLILLMFTSCGPTFIVDEYQPVDTEAWEYTDLKSFSFTIADTQQLYALHLVLEHSPDFFAQNVYIEITTQRPDGSKQADEVSLQMADKFGQWFGDCTKESCELDILIQPVAYFDQIGEYTLSVAQHSRKVALTGIQGLRFQIEELEERK